MSPRPPRPSFDFSASQSRTKEENQERAFIAASRRKDRSLDARIESANRASMLHKQRTGRALHITRDIVNAEAMYEEIDDTYRAKLHQYMRAQSMQLSQDFDNSLLLGITNTSPGLHMPSASNMHMSSSHSSNSPRHHRRASSLTPSGPIHGARKLSLDLSQLRTSLPGPRTDPLGPHSANSISTPGSNFSPSYSTPVQAQAQTQTQAQMPSYVASGTPTFPMRPPPPQQQQQQQQPQQQPQQLMQTWDGLFPGHSMPPSSALGGLPMHAGQFRNRIGSAPTIPVRAQMQAQAQASSQASSQTHAPAGIPTPALTGPRGTSQHLRVRSEPGCTPTPSSSSSSSLSLHTGFFPNSTSSSSDPSSSSELLPTPGSTSPHTPVSQASNPHAHFSSLDLTDSTNDDTIKYTPDELQGLDLHLGLEFCPQQFTDQDFLDFSQFASTLDNNQCTFPFSLQMPLDSGNLGVDAGFDEGPDLKEYITNM